MTQKRPMGLPSVRLVAIAAVAGMVAGGIAVYVKETGSGNGTQTAQTAGCETAAETVKTIRPLIRGQVAALVAADPARAVEGLNFKDASGSDKTMAAYAGKAVLVNLWATWCLPCREEMPALNRLQGEKGGASFDVIAINIDTGSDDKPRAFLAENGIDHLGFYRDSSMGVFNALKKQGLALGLPVTLVLDKKGCLLGSMNGPAVWDGEDAKALIDRIAAL